VTPLAHFKAVWDRCAQLSSLHGYLAKNTSGVLQPDELLRAEWVARLSALDLYVHELVTQLMLDIFAGRRSKSPAYLKFQISTETVDRIRAAASPADAASAFELDVRYQLSYLTFQDPEKIADAVRLCSTVELWNEVALKLGATPATKVDKAKEHKRDLSLLARRRNQIAHEGDLQPAIPREPWPISKTDLEFVEKKINDLVTAIDLVV
jgi:hypothetical protein